MANLNIPFLLLQPSLCSFSPQLNGSKIIPYSKYNFKHSPQSVKSSQASIIRQNNSGHLLPPDAHQQFIHQPKQSHSNFRSELFQNQNSFLEYGKLSSFDDNTQKNLVVLSDSQSGIIILCHQEHYISTKKVENAPIKQKAVTKYLVNLVPRVALIPSISEEVGILQDMCLVRSPAPNILSTSSHFLVTLHADNRIRLWNTNDGRCVLASQKDMLVTRATKLKAIKNHPGNILVIGEQKDVYIVNIYKMMVYKHFQYDIEGSVNCIFKQKNLIICDQKGKIYVWRDESEPSPIKNHNNSVLFELSNNQDEYETFNYVRFRSKIYSDIQNLQLAIGEEEDIKDNKTLAFNYLNEDKVFVISSYRLDFYHQKTRKTIFKFNVNNKIVFGKFINISEREMIIIVTSQMNIYLFDQTKLKDEVSAHNNQNMNVNHLALVNLNLIKDSRFFEHSLIKHDDQNNLLHDAETIKQEFVQNIEQQLKNLFNQQDQIKFRYSKQENMLYTFMEINKEQKMVSWSLTTLIENLNYTNDISFGFKIPMFSNCLNIFPQVVPDCPINFYSLVIKNIYNKHQFQFFFADEKVNDSVIYTSVDHPSLIIGTNYGRIFMVPMFQEGEKIQPIILIDTHRLSPIIKLFVAYDSCRKLKTQSKKSQYHQQQKESLLDTGGHLISISEDGTIAVTNLHSLEIQRSLHNFSLSENKSRADQFMNELNQNRQHKRRNSFTQCFSMNQFYNLAKCKSQMVYYNTTFGSIDRVIEVKSIQKVQEKLLGTHQHKKYGFTPDRKTEEDNQPGKRRGSFQAQSYFTDDNLLHQNPQYACLSSDGVVVILQLSNLTTQMTKLHGIDSKAIGVYSNEELNQYYVLTENLNFLIFNKNSCILERKADYKFAINSLLIKETYEHLLNKNDSLRFSAKGDHNVFEYESFERIFKKKSLLMGQGSHKILDYLSLSLNVPLKYHPHSIYTNKYTKIIQDLLRQKQHLADFNKSDEAQKEVLRAINEGFFYNNLQYKSDFKEEYFNLQTGVTCMQTNKTVFNSNQQMIMTCTKHMMRVMAMKFNKLKNSIGSITGSGVSGQMKKMNFQPRGEQQMEFQDDNDDNGNNMHQEELKSNLFQSQNTAQKISPRERNSRMIKREGSIVKSENEPFANVKWPNRLLSLVHPFNIDMYVDELLERFLGLNLPFLDFRIGIQGADESFSFVISKEDEDFHSERNNISKLLRQLNLSKLQRSVRKAHKSTNISMDKKKQEVFSIIELNHSDIEQDSPVRFFGSEQWKISSYLSTIVPTFFLSTLVSIVEYSMKEMTELIQEWLFILSKINQQKTLHNENTISLSVVSKLLLKKDPNISSTGRDVIMKPILYTIDTDQLRVLIDEWSQLILETYKKLKKNQSVRSAYGQSSNAQQSHLDQSRQMNSSQSTMSQISQGERKQINSYFGELEIRGLVNVSNYALYNIDQLDSNLQYRVSKLTTILTREIVQKYTNNKRYIHLLILLLQILGIWMRSLDKKATNKALINEVIKLLLYIYNLNKSPLNREHVIIRVNGENFHLIKPTIPELYLKLTAARALLEIGENFTNDFLQIIQDESTQLSSGAEYQQNVLEILKFFINSYGENLENHLIQLTQILLKCLDPNELALRKNSHKIIGLILSIMVKMFPMVAFHHESQRLAVGTHDGPIAIYDVRTSAKWKILEGHSGNVTCLTFDSKGNLLASYSAKDCTLRLWKVGNTGFFSTIMGGTGKSSNTINLERLKNIMNPHDALEKRRQSMMISQNQDMRQSNNILDEGNQNQISSHHHGGAHGQHSHGPHKRINRCSLKFVQPKEKYVELTREDGKTAQYKLVK